MQNSVRQNSQLVLNSFRSPQPVQTDESISYVVAGPQAVDQSGRRIQNRLESTHQVSRKADQHAVSIVQTGVHQCDQQVYVSLFLCFPLSVPLQLIASKDLSLKWRAVWVS